MKVHIYLSLGNIFTVNGNLGIFRTHFFKFIIYYYIIIIYYIFIYIYLFIHFYIYLKKNSILSLLVFQLTVRLHPCRSPPFLSFPSLHCFLPRRCFPISSVVLTTDRQTPRWGFPWKRSRWGFPCFCALAVAPQQHL